MPEILLKELWFQDGLKDYIVEFQAFAGLPQTGELDNSTVTLMNTPRYTFKFMYIWSLCKKLLRQTHEFS